MPPALATAIAKDAGHDPAIGAIRIGSRRPYFAQNAATRSRGLAFKIDGVTAIASLLSRRQSRAAARDNMKMVCRRPPSRPWHTLQETRPRSHSGQLLDGV